MFRLKKDYTVLHNTTRIDEIMQNNMDVLRKIARTEAKRLFELGIRHVDDCPNTRWGELIMEKDLDSKIIAYMKQKGKVSADVLAHVFDIPINRALRRLENLQKHRLVRVTTSVSSRIFELTENNRKRKQNGGK